MLLLLKRISKNSDLTLKQQLGTSNLQMILLIMPTIRIPGANLNHITLSLATKHQRVKGKVIKIRLKSKKSLLSLP
jgi:hypothetical protein